MVMTTLPTLDTMVSAPAVWLTTLGCAKNQVDSDEARSAARCRRVCAGILREVADVVMVNTCAFIEAARREVGRHGARSRRPQADRRSTHRPGVRWRSDYQKRELGDLLPEADAVLGMEKYTAS